MHFFTWTLLLKRIPGRTVLVSVGSVLVAIGSAIDVFIRGRLSEESCGG